MVPFEPIEDNKRQRRRRDADIKAALNRLKAR
jgi:hypothetical protein